MNSYYADHASSPGFVPPSSTTSTASRFVGDEDAGTVYDNTHAARAAQVDHPYYPSLRHSVAPHQYAEMAPWSSYEASQSTSYSDAFELHAASQHMPPSYMPQQCMPTPYAPQALLPPQYSSSQPPPYEAGRTHHARSSQQPTPSLHAPAIAPRYSQCVRDGGVNVFAAPVRCIGAMRTNILAAAQATQEDGAVQETHEQGVRRDDGVIDSSSSAPMEQIGSSIDEDLDPNAPVVHCPDGYVDLAAALDIICLADARSIKPTKTKFETYIDLKDRVQLLAAVNQFQVSKEHQSSMRKIRCRSDKCQFLVQANVGKKGISVTAVCMAHNHSLPHSTPMPPGTRNTTVSTDMLVKFAVELELGHTLVRDELIRAVRDKFGITISSSRVALLKKGTKKRQVATIKDQFAKLSPYLEKLVEANPGMYAAFTKTGSSCPGAFCVPACFRQDTKMFLLPIVFLGARPIKDDMRAVGTLLSATSRDGNGDIVPIAFALVQGDLVDTWDWFCAHLALAGVADFIGWSFVSDCHPDLLRAVQKYFPRARHRFCMRRMIENIKRSQHSVSHTDEGTLFALASSKNSDECTRRMTELWTRKPAVAGYMSNIPTRHWATYASIEDGFPTFDAAASESSDYWLGADLGGSDPVGVLYFYLSRLNETFNDRLEMHSKGSGILTNNETTAFGAVSVEARNCTVTDLRTGHSFIVTHSKHRTPDKARLVDITAKTCQCGAWQDHLKPCMHAVAVAMFIGAEPLTWYHTAYRRYACVSLYRNPLMPLPPHDLSMDSDMVRKMRRQANE